MASRYNDGFDAPLGESDYSDDYIRSESIALGPMLRHALALVRRNIWLAGAIVGTSIALAAIITVLTTPKYTAQASIEITYQTQQVLGEDFDQTATEEVSSWDAERFLNSQISILRSRMLADRVARRLDLFSGERFFTAVQLDPADYNNESELRTAVLDLLIENLEIALPVDSRVAEVRFTSTDPHMSAAIANGYVEEFIQANLQRKFDSSSYARDFVAEQLQQARARLEDSEQNLNAYARQASLIRARNPSSSEDATTSNSITTSSLLQLNQAANQATAERIAQEARWNAERAQPLFSSPAALASPIVQNLLERRAEIQAQLANASERYLSDHPSVRQLASDLEAVEIQLTAAATQARDAVRAEYVAARAAEQDLQAQVNGLEGATMQEQDRSVRYNTLAREADTNRSVYEGLLQRYRELNASAGITASNIAIVDIAERPERPSYPDPILNLALGLLFGLASAAIVVFLKDQLDDRIRVPEEVEQKVGLNLLGVIPQAQGGDPKAEVRNPKSAMAESYSSLRSSLLYSTREGLPPIMLVTSAQASEGKSTTAYAIARGLALIGKRTLLVDADLRRPSAHKLAEVANTAGLSNVLVGERTHTEVLVNGDTESLFILPSGPIPPSPAELLASARLLSLFDTLRQEFDCVIVDSAPVLGLADSPNLSAIADGVLLVVEANRGRGGQLKAAVRRLRIMMPKILGVVLTKFDPSAAGNAYSTYYSYDYYTYREEAAQ